MVQAGAAQNQSDPPKGIISGGTCATRDLKKYAAERKRGNREFAEGIDEAHAQFQIGAMLRKAREAAGLRQEDHCCNARRRKSKGTGVIARQTRSTYFGNGNSRLIPAMSPIPPPPPMMPLPGTLKRTARTRYR